MLICPKCFKEILSKDHYCLGEPERYHEWMSWRMRKDKYEKVRSDNTWTTRNREDDKSTSDS